jgi:hypothetical protein
MGLATPDTVKNLQTALHAKAKTSPTYRFYPLYDKVSRLDVLWAAYQQCRRHGGAAGVATGIGVPPTGIRNGAARKAHRSHRC